MQEQLGYADRIITETSAEARHPEWPPSTLTTPSVKKISSDSVIKVEDTTVSQP